MKTIRWLIGLADIKPIIFSIAMLLIAISILAIVVRERNDRLNDCDREKSILTAKYQAKVDSLAGVYRAKEEQLNEEVKQTLNTIISNYKEQLKEQRNINQQVDKVINKNEVLINKKH